MSANECDNSLQLNFVILTILVPAVYCSCTSINQHNNIGQTSSQRQYHSPINAICGMVRMSCLLVLKWIIPQTFLHTCGTGRNSGEITRHEASPYVLISQPYDPPPPFEANTRPSSPITVNYGQKGWQEEKYIIAELDLGEDARRRKEKEEKKRRKEDAEFNDRKSRAKSNPSLRLTPPTLASKSNS